LDQGASFGGHPPDPAFRALVSDVALEREQVESSLVAYRLRRFRVCRRSFRPRSVLELARDTFHAILAFSLI
jgi:hypothetical protein